MVCCSWQSPCDEMQTFSHVRTMPLPIRAPSCPLLPDHPKFQGSKRSPGKARRGMGVTRMRSRRDLDPVHRGCSVQCSRRRADGSAAMVAGDDHQRGGERVLESSRNSEPLLGTQISVHLGEQEPPLLRVGFDGVEQRIQKRQSFFDGRNDASTPIRWGRSRMHRSSAPEISRRCSTSSSARTGKKVASS